MMSRKVPTHFDAVESWLLAIFSNLCCRALTSTLLNRSSPATILLPFGLVSAPPTFESVLGALSLFGEKIAFAVNLASQWLTLDSTYEE